VCAFYAPEAQADPIFFNIANCVSGDCALSNVSPDSRVLSARVERRRLSNLKPGGATWTRLSISHKGCGLSRFEDRHPPGWCRPPREKAPTTDDRETWFKKGRGGADADPNSIVEVWNSGGGNDLTVMDENGTEEQDDDAEKELPVTSCLLVIAERGRRESRAPRR
jgi:hypothetical protein